MLWFYFQWRIYEIKIMVWSNYSKIKLNDELNKIDFASLKNLQVNEKSENLCENMTSAINKLVGKKTVKLIENNKWFDHALYIPA
jgi:hypothetical protein